ncbi:MAG: sensor histidine kinase [Bacteroidetes bacterium]|nr:sensor histidine kinase [Bacteroidota bacterium]
MASIGQLTAGVAHELNNPINFVNAGAVGLERDVKDLLTLLNKYEKFNDGEHSETGLQLINKFKQETDYEFLKSNVISTIEDIKLGAQRTTEIVKGLRSFSRLDTEEKVATSIHQGLNDTLTILNAVLKNKVEVVRDYDDTVQDVIGFPGQLNQVFLNLIVNAEQAINNSGTISITTEDTGKGVNISIKDSGCGISEEVRPRVFDPFFTTKEIGEGMGLGLSISYGIIQTHKGTITLESEVGKGTEFKIYLPYKTS